MIIEKKDSKINVYSILDTIFISEHGSCGSELSDSAVFLLEGLKKPLGGSINLSLDRSWYILSR